MIVVKKLKSSVMQISVDDVLSSCRNAWFRICTYTRQARSQQVEIIMLCDQVFFFFVFFFSVQLITLECILSLYLQKLLDGVLQAIKLLILKRLNRGTHAARIWVNRKHVNAQHNRGCLWYKIVYVHVSRIVSVLTLKTHIHWVWCRQLKNKGESICIKAEGAGKLWS